jgi:HK97 family phage major capsid protein
MTEQTSRTAPKVGDIEHREFVIDRASGKLDEQKRTVEISFSSEEPAGRWYGSEILDHTPKACDLTRLRGRGAMLVEHNRSDIVGVVEDAWLDGKKGRARVRFGKSARASEVWQDVLDGIRSSCSVGYQVDEIKLESSKDGEDTYRVLKWTPLEVSLVSIPADTTVGVGRSQQQEPPPAVQPTAPKPNPMILRDKADNDPTGGPKPEITAEERKRITDSANKFANERANTIMTIGARHLVPHEKCLEWLNDSTKTVEQFQAYVLEQRSAQPLHLDKIGMTSNEVKQYSLVRALRLLHNKQPLDGIEAAASAEVAKRLGKNPNGFYVPADITTTSLAEQRGLSTEEAAAINQRLAAMRHTRALNATTGSAGGFTIGTDVLGSSLITLLRNQVKVVSLGARMLTGLQGNVSIPKQVGGATAQWLAEGAASTPSQQTFGQLLLSPHRLACEVAYTHQLLIQSSIDIEAFVREDITRVMAIEIDRAAIAGDGAGAEPLGILNTTGINAITFGGAPIWADLVMAETLIAQDNADVDAMAWLLSPGARGRWKTALAEAAAGSDHLWPAMGVGPNGYRAAVSNNVPGDKVIFGNWSDLIIAQWDGLDVVVDPYTLASNNMSRIVINQHADIGVRHPQSFAASTDSGAQA